MEREDTTARQPQVKNESGPSSSLCARSLNHVSSVCRDCSHGSRTPRAACRCQEFRSPVARGREVKFCLFVLLLSAFA